MTILITTGHRPRISRKQQKASSQLSANIPRGRTFASQEQLREFWASQLDAVPKEHYVPGIGDNGIFSNALTTQIDQIATLGDAWGWSLGLGYVNFAKKYPNFSFGEYEGDLSAAVTDESFNPREWWKFITTHMGMTLRQIVKNGIETKQQVIITPSTQMYPVVAGELAALTTDESLSLSAIQRCLRLVGADLDQKVPPNLLDCVMPYDAGAIDAVVPGTTSNRSRRIAFLLTKLRPDSDDPIEDFRAIQAYAKSKSSPILEFKADKRYAKSKAQTLAPDELRKIINANYRDRCHGLTTRIARMMRHDGYMVTYEQVDAILNGNKPSTKPVEQSGQTAAKAAKPATSSTAKPAGKAPSKAKSSSAKRSKAATATATA